MITKEPFCKSHVFGIFVTSMVLVFFAFVVFVLLSAHKNDGNLVAECHKNGGVLVNTIETKYACVQVVP